MNNAKMPHLLSLLLLIFAFSAQAEAPLWKIENGGKHLFIGGTIHLLTPSDYPLPAAFEVAYKQSAKVVLETDMQKTAKSGVSSHYDAQVKLFGWG